MNVRIGSLAIVVHAGHEIHCLEVLDRVVEVLRPAYDGEQFTATSGERVRLDIGDAPCWVVKSRGSLPWKVLAGPQKGEVFMFRERAIRDSCLREINGPHLSDEVLGEVNA